MRFDFKNNPKLGKLVTIVLVGLLLLIVALPVKNIDTDRGSYAGKDGDQTGVTEYDSTYYEERLKSILEESYGAGTMSVMVNISVTDRANSFYGESHEEVKVDGVLVVADVKDAQAVSDITYAVCALFDLPAHKVAVILKD